MEKEITEEYDNKEGHDGKRFHETGEFIKPK